jgi:hypothetical protein
MMITWCLQAQKGRLSAELKARKSEIAKLEENLALRKRAYTDKVRAQILLTQGSRSLHPYTSGSSSLRAQAGETDDS